MLKTATIEDKDNIVGRIERLPITGFTMIIVAVAAIGNFFDIFSITNLGSVLPAIDKQFALSGFLSSQLVASFFIGMFVGSIIIGMLVDRVGRRPLFNATLLIVAVGSLITAFAANYFELYSGRFITGIAVGGDFAAVWAYFNELVPKSSRGRYYGLALGIGIASIPAQAFAAKWFLTIAPVVGWRYSFIVAVVVAVAVIPLRALAPESPRFYLMRGEYDKAEKQMKMIEDRISKKHGKLPEPSQPASHIMKMTSIAQGYKMLFEKGQAAKTSLITLIWIFQTWGFYGFNAFLVYVLYEKGFSLVHSIGFAAIGFIGGFFGPFVLVALVGDKRIQRRHGLIIFSIITAVLDIIFAYSTSVVEIVTLAFLINMTMQAFASHLHSYTPEMFPTMARGLGGGFADGIGRLLFALGSAVIASTLAGKPIEQFLFIGVSWIAVAICAYAIKINTNLRTLEELTESPTA